MRTRQPKEMPVPRRRVQRLLHTAELRNTMLSCRNACHCCWCTAAAAPSVVQRRHGGTLCPEPCPWKRVQLASSEQRHVERVEAGAGWLARIGADLEQPGREGEVLCEHGVMEQRKPVGLAWSRGQRPAGRWPTLDADSAEKREQTADLRRASDQSSCRSRLLPETAYRPATHG